MKNFSGLSTAICVTLFLFPAIHLSAQTTLQVPADFATIQQAIQAATNGDTVLVAPGTYQENLSFLGKAIHVKSEAGPETTTIDANQSGSAVIFVNDEGADSILEGFTVTGGTGTLLTNGDRYGGGVFALESSPTIRGNIVANNSVAPFTLGGGIAYLQSDALLENNTISMNLGGGVHVSGGNGFSIITGNTVDGNLGGEGIQVASAFGAMVEDNLAFNNGQEGIDLSSLDIAIATRNVLMMNGTEGVAQDGIRLTSCDSSEVSFNQIFASNEDGIVVRSSGVTSVTDNFVEGCAEQGIFVWVVDQAYVARNFSGGNSGTGMILRNVDDLSCDNNVTVHNGGDGIQVRSSFAIVNGITSVQNGANGFTSSGNDLIEISNSVFRDNSNEQIDENLFGEIPLVNNSNVQGGYDGIGNIDSDPLFVSPDGPDGDPNAVSDNDYRLLPGSPCIDTGDSSSWLCVELDALRNPRVLDGLLDGNTIADMGAHEFNNVYLSVIGDAVSGSTVNVVTTGTAGLSIEILVGIVPAENCTAFGPIFLDETTAVSFGPVTSPVDMQIELPQGSSEQFIIQARAIDQTGMTGNTSNAVVLNRRSFTIQPDSFDLFRGILVSGDLADLQESDDAKAIFNPGFTLSSVEAPVWLVFNGSVSLSDAVGFRILKESNAGTPGLTATIEAWNWVSGVYDVVNVADETFALDAITTINLDSGIDQYIEVGTGSVRTRVGWRRTGFTINFPWEIRLDQVAWIAEQ